MCSGFKCLKNSLITLNVIFVVVSFILIGVAAYGKASNLVTGLPVIGGIVACGFFLLLTSILGLVGTAKHHQVLLFFYMVILFLLFIIQFSIACACLAFSTEQQKDLARIGWEQSGNGTRADVQKLFSCCGFNSTSQENDIEPHPQCPAVCCAAGSNDTTTCCDALDSKCECQPCLYKLGDNIGSAFSASGGLGLFFSFTEVVGFVLTYKFRLAIQENSQNPQTFN